MIKYISNKGGGSFVDFETAILDGFAVDGGLYVPDQLPQISISQLEQWAQLNYVDLAFEVLSLFIDRSTMTALELKTLLEKAFAPFEKEDIIPIHQLQSRKDTYILELFYGPTLSFKDIGLAFLVNLFDFFLQRRDEKLSIIVATTGDTGPATAYFSADKSTLDTWVLYPKGMITEEQERQMTTHTSNNIFPVGVWNCPDGGDDLDLVIANLYANIPFKEKLNLSSVNSINWGRIMMQTVHYFYAYFQVAKTIGEKVNMSVPSGGFGNLCGGAIARFMGLPIGKLICATNQNDSLHRIFSKGIFSKKEMQESASSAIDILIPYNFWRYLYFVTGANSKQIKEWNTQFLETGYLQFDKKTQAKFSKDFLSANVSDEATLNLIREIYRTENYLLDPHGAVALNAFDQVQHQLESLPTICLATAHPAKFPAVILKALEEKELPKQAKHSSIELAKKQCQHGLTCDHAHFEEALIHAMESRWKYS